ncbi:MAG: hypothetical protein ACK47B_20625 [Armatimonadota bacterium]
MTRLLEQAIQEVRGLPASEQDEIAAVILKELEDERLWQDAFERSQDQLSLLAQEALAEHRAGVTRELEPDEL